MPTAGAPSQLDDGLSKAKDLWEKGKEIRDKGRELQEQLDDARETVDALSSDESGDEDDSEAVDDDPQSLPVDYSDTWADEPPGFTTTTTTTVVITRGVDPMPPPPIPDPPPQRIEPPTRVRGFIGLSVRGTSLNTNPSTLLGGRAGFTFRDRFTIGGAVYSLTGRYADPITDSRGRPLGLRMAYGGVLLGWRVYSGRVVHFGLETLAGAGAACVAKGTRSVGPARCIEKVGLVSLEPGVELGFVVTDWMKLGLDAGYRFITREAWRSPNDFTLSGPYVGFNVELGRFRDRR